MRIFIGAAALAIGTLLAATPAQAAMCGSRADVQTIETGSISIFNAHLHKGWNKIDPTYVMAIVVTGDYAEADISYAGQASYYWIKKRGTWTYSGNFMPKGWPSSVRTKLTTMFNRRANGSKHCTNPAFVPRGSG